MLNLVTKNINKEKVLNLSEKLKINPILTEILVNRSIESIEDANKFLFPDINDITNPFIIPDMAKAVNRLRLAIKNKEKILIYGDKDVDGQLSIVLLKKLLSEYGINASYYIPTDEGYGLHETIIPVLKKQKIDLLMTVDCGITSANVTELIKDNGIDVIITDHHEVQDTIPKANAVINPKLIKNNHSIRNLSGCGVVFMLGYALKQSFNYYYGKEVSDALWHKIFRNDITLKKYIYDYIDLVAIATIADVMPILHDNRIFVKFGLQKLNKRKNSNLNIMLNNLFEDKKIYAKDIAWVISPLINACGRLKNPEIGVNFFLSNNLIESQGYYDSMQKLNNKRKKLQDAAKTIVDRLIDSDNNFNDAKVSFIVTENIEEGILGIIAGHLVRKHKKPALVMLRKDNEVVGSVRSFANFDLTLIFDQVKDLLIRYGGHKLACGFTLDINNIEAFKTKVMEVTETLQINQETNISLDISLCVEDLYSTLLDDIEMLEPFGNSNEFPVIQLNNVSLVNTKRIGKEANHIRADLVTPYVNFNVIGWNKADLFNQLKNVSSLLFKFDRSNNLYDRNNFKLELLEISSEIKKNARGEI